jgi:hypothetical protein
VQSVVANKQVKKLRLKKSTNLVAKPLREKRVNEGVWRTIGDIEDLGEIWDILYICSERPEKYMSEALKPIIKLGDTRCQTKWP